VASAIEADVREVLDGLEPDVFEVVHGAWEAWKATALQVLFPRTRAVLMHDLMVRRAIAQWGGRGDIHFVERDETVKFLVKQRLLLRFKKASGNGLGSNIPTQAVLAFTDPQMLLPGIPDVQKVEVLYELNDLETKIERVVVVARDGDRKIWEYEIEDRRVLAPVLPLPSQAPASRAAPVVRLRKNDQDQKSKSET
jgi:hypothetical protein